MFILLGLILLFSAVPAGAFASVDQALGKTDLAFEQNQGQADAKVNFLARAHGYGVFLTDSEAVMRFTTPKSSVIRMKFLGQKRNARIEGLDALTGTTNYLLGNGSPKITNIHSYKRVRYSGVYSGIDVEYHGSGRFLEYDFIVKPGANPDKIRIGFSGIRGVSVDSSGDLVLKTDAEPIIQKKPHVYQEIDGRQENIEAAYVVAGNHVGFKLDGYDRTRPLIIDPELVYSTFFGGTGSEIAYGIAVDPQGAVYVAGSTTSADFPVVSAAQGNYLGGSTDAFVFKLNPGGSQIVYSTFIGGAGGDEAHSIAVDSSGNAYITGFTQSNDFPIVNGFQKTRAGLQDAYVVKLNGSGTSIIYSSFLGGSADDRGFGIALDPANNAYITGITSSTNFLVSNPYQRTNAGGFADGFIAKISATGGLVYSTYVGGIGNDNPLGIAVDAAGAAYVTGWTTSINFPLVKAFQTKFGGLDQPIGTDDVFVLKLNPSGTALDYSSYIGGIGSDEGTRIAVDSAGSAYVTGSTSSVNFPTVTPYQAGLANGTGTDAFVAKVAADGTSLQFSTFLGGFQNESGDGIAVDASGAVYVSGYTTSFDFPTANQVQGSLSGPRDAFVAKLDPVGNVLVFSTFLGGSGTESATGLTIDSAGNAYVIGFTDSGDLATANAIQPGNAGGQDIFVAKLNVQDIVSSTAFQIAPQGTSTVVTTGTRTDSVFGYAVAEPVVPNAQVTGLAIIKRTQSGAIVNEVGVPSTPFVDNGRLFVDVTSSGRSVLSIANPSDQDANVDFFYTDQTGATTQFANTTVSAHQHFSRFVTDAPLSITAPGTLNFTSSIPVVATAFFTTTNESSDFLISHTPIVDPIAYTLAVADKPVSLPELADGGGWKSDIILVNTSEDRMNGEVRFFSQGSGSQPGVPLEVGIGDANTPASVQEFDIPPRTFQRISTSGASTSSEVPFALTAGTDLRTPGAGTVQVTGWASADSTNANERLNGLQILEYRQLGITQSQTGIIAPSARQTGRFFAEVTDKIRSFIAIANPGNADVTVAISLTDENGTSTDQVTVTVPAAGQYSAFLGDAPISLPLDGKRTVDFSASSPVFVTALRFFTNERNDSILSVIPIADINAPVDQPIIIPHFTDGTGWKTRIVLVNNTDERERGEIRFFSQGSATQPVHPVVIGTDSGDGSVFEYDIPPRSFFLVESNGFMENLSAGSVQIVPFGGFHTPAAHALLSNFVFDETATEAAGGDFRFNTNIETSVEGEFPATTFRFYAEASGDFNAGNPKSTRTGLAIANPSSAQATVQLELTSFAGVLVKVSSPIAIPAGGQVAAYLHEFPGFESLPVPFQGIVRLSVISGSGVTASDFRIMRNERLDYLATSTGPLKENAGMPGQLVFPYMSDSTGYTTQFILINQPGAPSSSGVLHYRAADSSPLQIDTLKLGSIQIVPFGGFATPHAHVMLSHRDGGVLTSITGMEGGVPARTFRVYAESVGDFDSGIAGSTRSAIAVANPSGTAATVVVEVRDLNGALLKTSQPLQVPANGQIAYFLNQVPGLETLGGFEGVVTIAATAPQTVTAAGFLTLYNERGNILYTTTGPLFENAASSTQLVFPHIAEGGGYTTQFVVIGGISGQATQGTLRFFTEQGSPLNMTLGPR